MDKTESTVRVMLAAIEGPAPLYDVGVLSELLLIVFLLRRAAGDEPKTLENWSRQMPDFARYCDYA